MSFNRNLIDQHKQLYYFSCIPSSVEMVLKSLARLKPQEYPEQSRYDNRSDLGFGIYENVTVEGVTFRLVSGDFATLKARIELELAEGRMPIVSIRNPSGFHMWVVHEEVSSGIFKAFSKSAPAATAPSVTIDIPGNSHSDLLVALQQTVDSKGGQSDILVYAIS